MSRRGLRRDELDPFTDLLFNALLALTVMFVVALLAMQPPARSGDIEAKAELIISATWPDGNPNDIDLWVQGPDGDLIWFREPQSGLLALDRDDRGEEGDSVIVDGQTIVNPLNQEVVTLRGIVPGEYIVNLQYYQSVNDDSVPVTVSLAKVNPRLKVVFHQVLTLSSMGDETTALRFTLGADGEVAAINRIQKRIALGA